MNRPVRQLTFGLLVAIVFMGCLEIILRLAEPRLTWEGARIDWEGGEELEADRSQWPPTWPRGKRGTLSHLDFSVPVAFNTDGFRDADFDPESGRVVIFLGDSSTEGHGVRIEDTFASQIEVFLADRFGDIEVWNAGRSGTGTVHQVRILERILNQYPEAEIVGVVLMTCASMQRTSGNDLMDNRGVMPYLESGRPEERPGKSKKRLKYVIRSTAILHAAEYLLSGWRRRHVRLPRIPEENRRWSDYYACLDRARELCSRYEVPLLVAGLDIYPSDRPQDLEELEQRFREYTDRVGLPFVMCSPQVLEDDNWFFPHDGHPNETGHRFVFATLRESVAKLLSDP